MPKVYSWNALVRQQIATPERLEIAKSTGMSLLKRMHEHGWIVAAGMFGSVARKDYSLGSDLDVVIVSKPEFQRAVNRTLERSFRASMENLFVEPEIIHINSEEARTGNHSIDRLLFRHIHDTQRKELTVGKPLMSVIELPNQNVFHQERNVFEHTANAISKERMSMSFAKAHNAERYHKALEHAIEKTLNAARHVLDLANKLPKRRGRIDDRKSVIMQLYPRVFADKPELVAALKKVATARDSYFAALKNAVAALKSGNGTRVSAARKQYESALRGIEQTMETNQRFFKENAKLIQEIEAKRARATRARAPPRIKLPRIKRRI